MKHPNFLEHFTAECSLQIADKIMYLNLRACQTQTVHLAVWHISIDYAAGNRYFELIGIILCVNHPSMNILTSMAYRDVPSRWHQ